MSTHKLDTEAFKKAAFSYEEIESVKRGLDDIKKGRTYSESEFYTKVEKRLFAQREAHV